MANLLKKNNCEKIIIDFTRLSQNCPQVTPNRFYVLKHCTIGRIIGILRCKLHLPSFSVIFISCNNTILNIIDSVQNVHERFKKNDNVLYFSYDVESTFG